MKSSVQLAALAVMIASLSGAQSVTLSIPALDQSGNPVPIGKFYAIWQPFRSNSGVTIPGGAISSNITAGVINTTLTASDGAGYVYDILIMNGATPNTFQWKVPAAGATTMAELNKPSVSEGGGASGPAGGDLSGAYPNPTIATGKPSLDNIGNAAMPKTFSMGSNFLTFTFGNATSSGNMFTATDTASNTGTGYVATIGSASGSSAKPFQVLCGGTQCVSVTAGGMLLNTSGASIFAGSLFGLSGLWFGANTASPGIGNYSVLYVNGEGTSINSPSGEAIYLAINGARRLTIADSGAAVAGTVRTSLYTVATLPVCNGDAEGSFAAVTDSISPTFLGTLSGGGSVHSPAYCDGTNWVAH